MLVASLLNLDAVVAEAREAGEVAILCAGVEGAFAIDDAYVAGRIAAALDGEPNDAAIAAIRQSRRRLRFGRGRDRRAARTSAANIRRVGLDEDIAFCAQESVLELVPQVVERTAGSVVVAGRSSEPEQPLTSATAACQRREAISSSPLREDSSPNPAVAARKASEQPAR